MDFSIISATEKMLDVASFAKKKHNYKYRPKQNLFDCTKVRSGLRTITLTRPGDHERQGYQSGTYCVQLYHM
jgi:hypothetical protein